MRLRAAVLLCALAAGQVFAQEGSQPQIAYRIFGDYIAEQEARSGRKGWAYVTIGMGGLLVAASGGMWFLGDRIFGSAPGWNQQTKAIVTTTFAGAGLSLAGVGLVGLCVPPRDLAAEYPLIFKETDPVVQEAMAVAALKDLAKHGRSQRVTGAILGIASPILTFAVQAIVNRSLGSPWYKGYEWVATSQIPQMVSAFAGLFRLSSEERLYEKYLYARSAIYGSP